MPYSDPHLRGRLPQVVNGLTPAERRWWRLLDDLPQTLRAVHRWRERPSAPAFSDGQLHANPTSVVCLAGVVRVVSGGARIDLGPGEALLIAPGVWHRHEPLRPNAVWFGQGFLAAWSDVVLGDRERCWTGTVPSDPARRLMELALGEADAARRRTRFATLMTHVLAESVDHQAFAHPALRAMLARMWSGLHLGISVADVLRASGLSRAQAYRVFTAGYGVPPKEALATNRLWLAAELLGSGHGVAETAARCGFPSPGTFTRLWKRRHGAPPQATHRQRRPAE